MPSVHRPRPGLRAHLAALAVLAQLGVAACAVSFDGYYPRQTGSAEGAGGSPSSTGTTTSNTFSSTTTTTTSTTTSSTTTTTTTTTSKVCDGSGNCQTCTDCAAYKGACKAAWSECTSTAGDACRLYLDCAGQCAPMDSSCESACAQSYGGGQAAAIAWTNCLYCTGCYADCQGNLYCK